jgi:hypothetical protein
MNKRDIINFLFIISFPVYGLGSYAAAVGSPSVGYMISIIPHLLIVVFYTVDVLCKREITVRVNAVYYLMLIFLVSTIISLVIALMKGLPEDNLAQTITKSIRIIVPFHAFLFFVLYNDDYENKIPLLCLISLSILLLINIAGYFGLGLTNATHYLEGRLNFPFMDGVYDGANLVAIINLLLLYYIVRSWDRPLTALFLITYFIVNLALFYKINSRLTMLIFICIFLLAVFRIVRARGLFALSLLTIPILLSSRLLIYDILRLPALSTIMKRIDIEDVTTYNGRYYLWRDAVDWLLEDRRGLLLGNGYKGHYFLDIISDVNKLWNIDPRDAQHMHLHSTSLEILICQGVVIFILFSFIFYRVYVFYKTRHRENAGTGPFFPVVLFLMFILQVDTFLYLDGMGFILFSLMASAPAVMSHVVERGHGATPSSAPKPYSVISQNSKI